MEAISRELRRRDEEALKRAEREWRQAMERDTAGHVFRMFQYVEARLADLQAQLDASNPVLPALRDLDARLAAIEAALRPKEEE